MNSIELKNRNVLAFKELLQGLQRLDIRALEKLADEINKLIAKRKKQPETDRETELIQLIRDCIPTSLRQRQKQLYTKLQEESISVKEKEELVLLNSMLEEKSAERIHLMGELAALKKITLPELIEQIDLKPIDE